MTGKNVVITENLHDAQSVNTIMVKCKNIGDAELIARLLNEHCEKNNLSVKFGRK